MNTIKKLVLSLTTIPLVGFLAASATTPSIEDWYEEQVEDWSEEAPPERYLQMRTLNPEWDFMARTFLSLTLAERALADPLEVPRALDTLDAIITDTLAAEAAHGPSEYLLPYAKHAPFLGGGRSLFVDGEILVMLGARRLVSGDAWGEEMDARASLVTESLGRSSDLPIAESYPNEGWMFCHVMAMIGLRMHEVTNDADHSALTERFVASVKSSLTHSGTGMMLSEFDMTGRPLDGPEGSSIWFTSVGMLLLDPEFAHRQYALAEASLGDSLLGMGYAREWPSGYEGPVDIDSGPLVPFINASASSSGFALLASQAFSDQTWNQQLHRALGAAFLIMKLDRSLKAAADNPVGQGVVLWGEAFGPVWERLDRTPVTADAGLPASGR
ncbi:MAG: hypothetical protein P8R54_19015 [Myxococcota bacterium]|nr:hypothetical protein [Myxococcota bacterium]